MMSAVTGIVSVGALAALWVAVQSAWRETFPEELREPDALAGRSRCGDCTNLDVCHSNFDEGQGERR